MHAVAGVYVFGLRTAAEDIAGFAGVERIGAPVAHTGAEVVATFGAADALGAAGLGAVPLVAELFFEPVLARK